LPYVSVAFAIMRGNGAIFTNLANHIVRADTDDNDDISPQYCRPSANAAIMPQSLALFMLVTKS
jgi:hypothetical protein